MKKTLAILFIALIATACSKNFLDEDPKGSLTTEGFCKNKAELDMAVTALYKALSTTGYSEEITGMFCGSDDLTTRAGSNKENLRDFDMFFTSKDKNVYNLDVWMYFYDVVNCANFVISNYQQAVTATEEERNDAAGQAYCLRAYSYFIITRLWKDAPLVTTNIQDKNIKKSTSAEIYDLIISDLQKAEVMLPDAWPSELLSGKGVTSGTAKSLLASVYLHMAGYPINDASKYALAASKSKEVIDNADLYGYSLLTNCQDIWLDNQTNTELIFGIFYSPSAGDNNYRAPMMGQPEDEGGWDEYFSEINFFNKFPAGPRKDATFQTIMVPTNGNGDSISWQDCAQKHPYYKKLRYANGSNPENLYSHFDDAYFWSYSSNRTTQVMRFAEVKLIYSEAQAMSVGPDVSAYKEINDVRNRAGLPDLTPGLSQTAFRDSVFNERAWEFAGPENGQRWFDLVRLERVEEANSYRSEDELPLQNPPSHDFYFAPIPYQEKLLNPNL